MRLLLAAITSATLLWIAPASAQDFTFTVPVRIENMRHIENAQVSCDVMSVRGVIRSAISVAPAVAVPVRDGSFSGSITVPVSISRGYTRADAAAWGCSLTYRWRMPDGTTFNRSLPMGERAGEYTRYTGQAVVSTVELVSGEVPR